MAVQPWLLIPVLLCALALGITSCAPKETLVSAPNPQPAAEDTFGFRKWVSRETKPDVVVIGIHGFCGASSDYTNLGNYLLENQPKSALYAYEVRGQGRDPSVGRRGDIGDPRDWYRDLFAFTQIVQERHPRAKIVWFGESMGALIAAHAWRAAPADDPPCDAIALSSPIVRFRDDIPAWTPGLVQIAATTLPLARISLETLSSGQSLQMTQSSSHLDQVQKNDYHVDKHTLRLIGALSEHIRSMNDCAATFRKPLLILHGGQDYFNNDADVRGFISRVPTSTKVTYRHYPQAYHLLMYDQRRDAIFKDVTRWLNQVRRAKF